MTSQVWLDGCGAGALALEARGESRAIGEHELYGLVH